MTTEKKNILILGGGAREHALAQKLQESPRAGRLYAWPGNGGMDALATPVALSEADLPGILRFLKEAAIDLVVVGPEQHVASGLTDRLTAAGVKVFGPSKAAGMLECSKAHAKDFMARHGIPTAASVVCSDLEEARAALQGFSYPVVIKADGLAAGKGVIIATEPAMAEETLTAMLTEHRFGAAGNHIVLEEFLTGPEVSVLAFVDGKAIVPMVSAMDYKRALDGDGGKNTGGMGAVSPAPAYTTKVRRQVEETIIAPTLAGLLADGIHYVGVLYFGIMVTPEGPKVLEYNARFGDPETEAVLLRLESDLFAILEACVEGRLQDADIRWSKDPAMTVVLASDGYPDAYSVGFPITGLPDAEAQGVTVFHAGTRRRETDGALVTAGGRVLAVSATGRDLPTLRGKIYSAVGAIRFEGMQHRRDIGAF